MFERFTERARQVLVLAQEEARLLNHNFIGTEHILLGLIHEGEGVAAKALESLGVALGGARAKVEEATGPGDSAATGAAPFTPRAKKVLELSLREALQLGHKYIGTEHLLLGLVREGEGVGAHVLVQLGADLPRVRQQVIQVLSNYGASGEEGAATLRGAVFVGFIPVRNLAAAREFYCGTLGLALVDDTPVALVVDAGGASLRLTEVPELRPQAFTIAGWSVSDISSTIASLVKAGVTMKRYEGMAQDDQGAWTTPRGDRVAWFADPDGNVLSITQAR